MPLLSVGVLDEGVHVLIDLGGYTAANRAPILAHRAAPIQLVLMPPSTLGAQTPDQ